MFFATRRGVLQRERVTMVGTMIPFLTRSSELTESTFRPKPFLAERNLADHTEPSRPAL